jgi:ferric iron reductase protein FhuF
LPVARRGRGGGIVTATLEPSRAPDADLRELVAADVTRLGLGDGEWLRFHFGPTPPSGVWTTIARLVDGAAAGLNVLADALRRARPEVSAELIWSGLHGWVSWPVTELVARYLATTGRLIRLAPSDVALGLRLDGPEPGVRSLWVRSLRVAVAADDEWAGDRRSADQRIEVVDDGDRLAALMATDVVELMTPVVEAIRARVSVGRRGLWAGPLDGLVWPFAERRPDDESCADAQRRVGRVLAAFVGTPLAQRVDWLEFDHAGRRHARLVTTACCLAYKWPTEPDRGPRRDGLDLQWDRYCASCPLLPRDEMVHRARYWLDHSEP